MTRDSKPVLSIEINEGKTVMHLLKASAWRRLPTVAALLLLVGGVGCSSGRYPVSGKVTYQDGSPVTEGSVIGEAKEGEERYSAQGSIQSDGSFQWGTERPRDGARPGKYRVVVVPRALGDAEMAAGKLPAIDPKFANPQTSGIDFEVKTSKNELNITVTRPQRRRSRPRRAYSGQRGS